MPNAYKSLACPSLKPTRQALKKKENSQDKINKNNHKNSNPRTTNQIESDPLTSSTKTLLRAVENPFPESFSSDPDALLTTRRFPTLEGFNFYRKPTKKIQKKPHAARKQRRKNPRRGREGGTSENRSFGRRWEGPRRREGLGGTQDELLKAQSIGRGKKGNDKRSSWKPLISAFGAGRGLRVA